MRSVQEQLRQELRFARQLRCLPTKGLRLAAAAPLRLRAAPLPEPSSASALPFGAARPWGTRRRSGRSRGTQVASQVFSWSRSRFAGRSRSAVMSRAPSDSNPNQLSGRCR